MKIRSRTKILAACAAVAFAQMAWADSAVGVDTAMGNTYNPRPINTSTQGAAIDPEGMGTYDYVTHTPSGQMYDRPLEEREDASKTAGGWEYFGHVEVGALNVGGDKKAQGFKAYKDVDSGLYLNSFGVTMNKKDSAAFFEAAGGSVGKDDQFYSLQFGRYNDWKVKTFYNETVHVFTSTYRSLWNGVGSGNVTLNGLPPGGAVSAAATDIAIGNAALATPYSELSIIRKKGGARLDMNLTSEWKAFASYSDEKRQGARPFGMVSAAGGGTGGVEIPESIDYNTRDLMAGLSYVDKLTSINLRVSASLFRNNIGTMTIENPMFLAAANGIAAFPRAVFDLVPNNDSYNVKGEFARLLPDFYKGRLTGVVSLTSNRQNDSLIASTPYAGATVNAVAGGAWDTTASLSKQSAGAKIDTKLFDLGLSLQPMDKLDVKGKIRHYETKNSTEYWACNPLTGQWGRLINDGSGSASPTNAAYLAPGVRCDVAATAALGVVPSAGNFNIRNIPYDYKQTNYTLGADYRLSYTSSVNANYEREAFDRKHRERTDTWEDKFKLGYVNRAIGDATLRLSGEHDRRRGSTYIPDPYDEFYSASLGPAPTAAGAVTSWIHVNSLHRKFDLADRDQSIFNARLNYALRKDIDAGVTLQLKDAKFPDAAYGRGSQAQNSLNFDLNWQPSSEMSISGYYSYANGKMKQKGLQQNACAIGTTYNFWSDGSVSTIAQTAAQLAAGITLVSAQTVTAANFAALCGTASATSPLYPTSRAWDVTQTDHNDVLGLGLKYDFGKVKLDMDYTFTVGTTGTKYNYNAAALGITTSGAPTAVQLATVGLIGDGFADLKTTQHVFSTSLLIPTSKTSSVRLLYRYETGKIRDWHYDGVAANPTPAANQQTYLDSGPQDYKTNTFGVLFNFQI